MPEDLIPRSPCPESCHFTALEEGNYYSSHCTVGQEIGIHISRDFTFSFSARIPISDIKVGESKVLSFDPPVYSEANLKIVGDEGEVIPTKELQFCYTKQGMNSLKLILNSQSIAANHSSPENPSTRASEEMNHL